MAAKFEIRSPKAGEFNWVLLSQGRTLAVGETYTRKVSCVNAVESVRKAAPTAAVDDTTVRPAPAKAPTAKTTARAAAKTARTTAKAAVKTGRAAGKVAAGAAKKTAPRRRAAGVS
jgi:uncharacterized protein YegP (UPF0339 family)